MQGLVAVGLGNGDVVLEAAREGLVQAMDRTQHAVAGVDLVDDDAEGVDIHDLVECPALLAHLLVDAVQVLFPAHYRARQTRALQTGLQRLENLVEQLLAVAAGVTHGLGDHARAHGVHGLEAQVLELGTQAVHAQAIGDGCIDLEGFAGNPAALFRPERAQGAHVVQTVGELDQDHPDVLGHGQGHLLEVLGLSLCLALELHLSQLADPVNQIRDGLAELRGQCFLGDPGVLDHVVQHGGHQALMVQAHVGEDARYRERVGDVGFAAAPGLPVVGLLGIEVGAAHLIDLLGLEIALEPVGEYFNSGHATLLQPDGRAMRCRLHGHRIALLRQFGFQRVQGFLLVVEGFLGHDLVGNQTLGDFAQGNDGRLVIFPGYLGFLAASGDLAGTLGRQHDQLEAVVYIFQAVFNGDAGHGVTPKRQMGDRGCAKILRRTGYFTA